MRMGGVLDVAETEGAGTEGTLWVVVAGGLGQVGVAVTAAKDTKQKTYMYM